MKNTPRTKLLILGAIGIFMMTAGLRCTFLTPSQQELLEPLTLNWWGTADEPEYFADIIASYRGAHPNITITYRRLRPEEFEQELVNALAEDRGPDIFSIDNTDLGAYLSKIEPLPPSTKMAYQVTQKSLGVKEETIVEVRETPSLTPAKVREAFLDVVSDDVIRDNRVWGLPLAVNTLVLFYNRDLLNNAGIPLPPSTWDELQEQTKKLTFLDRDGNLLQSGVALGTAKNITQSADILSLLMMQNGAEMTEDRTVTFTRLPQGADPNYNPGPEAIRFYTDFGIESREVFSWNSEMPEARDAFVQGKVAIIFDYSNAIPYIQARRLGKLNFNVAKVPQIQGRPEVNIAHYQIHTVAKKSKRINEAWDFIQFMTRQNEARKYLDRTGQTTALRGLVSEEQQNDTLRPFAEQLLTSKSWYRGSNATVVRSAFSDMIEAIINNTLPLNQAMQIAAEKIQQTL